MTGSSYVPVIDLTPWSTGDDLARLEVAAGERLVQFAGREQRWRSLGAGRQAEVHA